MFALLPRFAASQQTTRPYDGIQAGYDAYQLGEEKRQRNVGQQIYLNDRMRALTTPLATYGYGYGPYPSTYGVMPASRGGKLKTVIQTVAIFLYILPLEAIAPWLVIVAFWVMMAALAITLWTGAEYVVQALRLRAAGRRA